LELNNSGSENTASGSQALYNNNGNGNTAIGSLSLFNNVTGEYNTAIGYKADVKDPSFINATAIGAGAIVDKSDKVRIGDANVKEIEGEVAFSNPSDARFKNDIKQNVPGLDFITNLQPVTYYFDHDKLGNYIKTGNLSGNGKTKSKRLNTGFLAQDVEKIAKQLGYDFDGVNVPASSKGYYTLAYSQFVVPLVQAVKEQQLQIEQQKKENELLKNQMQLILERLEKLEQKKEN
jgi:hypothetical protein